MWSCVFDGTFKDMNCSQPTSRRLDPNQVAAPATLLARLAALQPWREPWDPALAAVTVNDSRLMMNASSHALSPCPPFDRKCGTG